MAQDEEQDERRGFKVQDRRRFTETGDAKPNPPPEAEPEPAPAAPAAAASEAASEAAAHAASGGGVPLTFSTFIISLSTQALAHLGEMPDPFTQQINVDLQAARQMIDILGMLQAKTRGNLDPSENQLLEGMLFDLRLRYVERAKR